MIKNFKTEIEYFSYDKHGNNKSEYWINIFKYMSV